MNRRQSLVALSALAGHSLFPEVLDRFGRALAASPGPADAWEPELLSADEGQLLAELAETILPETDTPGAKSARVHVFIDLALKHCYAESEQQAFVKGLATLATDCRDRYESDFAFTPAASRVELLQRLEAAANPFFARLKELTVLGYCMSEPGATRGLAYQAVPGEYRGCLELKPGQKGWATS